LIWVASEGKIKIAEVRRVQEELSLTNPFGKRRVVVLRRAETMTREAQNAFLKVLEEPRTDVVFILTAEDLAGLLPTVISRTQVVRFAPVSRDVIGRYLQTLGHAPETADRAARLSLGSPGRALELCVPGALVAREEENRQMLQLFGRLPHQRFRMVNQVLERDDPGALLSNLEGLLRDLWMFHTARRQYLVNRALQEELLAASYLFTREKICHCLIELHQLKNLWARQVNKKLSLERFFLTVLPIPE
jgi:DNA polymerase-3 subunit delta'